jgi:hypothetical protein
VSTIEIDIYFLFNAGSAAAQDKPEAAKDLAHP